MKSLIALASRNFLRRHPWQVMLAILGISLGVAVVVSIDLAKASALFAFDQAIKSTSGNATHRIVGGPHGVDEKLYTQLRVKHGLFRLAPKIKGHVKIGINDQKTVTLLGIDPLAEKEFQTDWYTSASDSGSEVEINLARMIIEPNTVLLSKSVAESLKVEKGEFFELEINSERKKVQLLDVLTPRNRLTQQSMAELIITDITSAQELLGTVGRLTQIDLVVDTQADDAQYQIKRIQAILPSGIELLSYDSAKQMGRQITRGFYTNLSALSLLSLLVGMFLIYNTMTFMVVQRRELIGMLRALGVMRREIFKTILMESLLLGLVGTCIGIALGIALGHGMVGLVYQTINSGLFRLASPELTLSTPVLGKGFLLGIGTTLTTASIPAFEATRITPMHALSRSQLESQTGRLAIRFALIGLVVILVGIGLTLLSDQSISWAFCGLIVVLVGCALMTPVVSVAIAKLVRPPLGLFFGIMGIIPTRSVTASLSRTGVAISALMIAIAATIGMQFMVSSFRLSVAHWLENRLNADLYISVSASTTSHSGLSRVIIKKITDLPDVKNISTVRRILVETNEGHTRINAYDLVASEYEGFQFKQGEVDQIWPIFNKQNVVIITESYAFHHNTKLGSTLSLRTDRGPHKFQVVGIYKDFNAGLGIVSMSRFIYDRHWHDDSYSGVWVYSQPNVDVLKLKAKLQELEGSLSNLQVSTNRHLVSASMEIFDQAFAITDVLRWLAALIAFIGVFSALMALQLERIREFGVLRAIGVTPRQLCILVLTETGLIGLIAGILAIPVGYFIAIILIHVINYRSFGWSLDLFFTPEYFIQGLILAVVAALLAGIYPAFKMARTSPAEALRTE